MLIGDDIINNCMNGGRSQVVKAVDCDSTIRGFKSHRPPSPYFKRPELDYTLIFDSQQFSNANDLCLPMNLTQNIA